MTNAEAVEILRGVSSFFGRDALPNTVPEAVELAITALELQLVWNSAENPPDSERNIFICHGSNDFKTACIGHYGRDMKMYYEDKNWFAKPMFDAMYWCEMPMVPVLDERDDT